VAAIYYASVVAAAGVLSDGEERTVFWTGIACVCVSIIVHGASASALTGRLLGQRQNDHPGSDGSGHPAASSPPSRR